MFLLVAANNLKIKPVITNFLEIPEETDIIIGDESNANSQEGE